MGDNSNENLIKTIGGMRQDLPLKLIPGVLGTILIWAALPNTRDVFEKLDQLPPTLGAGAVVTLFLAALVFSVGAVFETIGGVVTFACRCFILHNLNAVLQKLLDQPVPLHHDRVVPWYQRLWERIVRPEKQFLRMLVTTARVAPESVAALPKLALDSAVQGSIFAVFSSGVSFPHSGGHYSKGEYDVQNEEHKG